MSPPPPPVSTGSHGPSSQTQYRRPRIATTSTTQGGRYRRLSSPPSATTTLGSSAAVRNQNTVNSKSKATTIPSFQPSIYGSSFPPANQPTSLLSRTIAGEGFYLPSSFTSPEPAKRPLPTGTTKNDDSNARGLFYHTRKNPQRTTKTSQKLVLFPHHHDHRGDVSPTLPEGGEGLTSPISALNMGRDAPISVAELLPKEKRTSIPRVTSYCISESLDLIKIASYFERTQGLSPKQYDECLYLFYDSHPPSGLDQQYRGEVNPEAHVFGPTSLMADEETTMVQDQLQSFSIRNSKDIKGQTLSPVLLVPVEATSSLVYDAKPQLDPTAVIGISPGIASNTVTDIQRSLAELVSFHEEIHYASQQFDPSLRVIAEDEGGAIESGSSPTTPTIAMSPTLHNVDMTLNSTSASTAVLRKSTSSTARHRISIASPEMPELEPSLPHLTDDAGDAGLMDTHYPSTSRSPTFVEGRIISPSIPTIPVVPVKTTVAVDPAWMERCEAFIFDYGAVVFWNFSKVQELAFIQTLRSSFATNPLTSDDVEMEDCHFQYDLTGPLQPRIFNDMITLKSPNVLIKLTLSHGLGQSVKLALFENVMEETIEGTTPLPKDMAKWGRVYLSRPDVMKLVGKLFKLRMNVNLVSNVLDDPEWFWSNPELKGLYNAIRRYMEISQRAQLLNKRAEVISDLLDMLSDQMNSNEMNYITWIVIILICVAVVIAIGEVWVKILRLHAGMQD